MPGTRKIFALVALLSVGIVSVGIVLAPGATARAGGWDSLDFPEDHYLVGEEARTRDVFFAGALEDSGPLDGRTYYAYLLPRTKHVFAMIEAPIIPEGSIRLGALEIAGPFREKDGLYARASLAFTVPDVPTGTYPIGFCDDPCVHGTVGWLAWGSITIVHTEEEGELLAALARERERTWRLRYDLRRSERAAERLEARVAATAAVVRDARLQPPSVGLPELPERRPAGSAPEPTWPWWLVASTAVAAFVLGSVLGARRRRAQALAIPDSVPDDLERLERVG